MDIFAQVQVVRERAGWLDRSPLGKLAVRGADRFTWLQGMVSNDTRLLEQGAASLPACILNPTGHILTDLTLLNVSGENGLAAALGFAEPDFVLMTLPRENVERIAALLDRYIIMEDVELADVSDALACFSVQGPDARAYPATDFAPAGTAPPRFCVAADHTGSGGFDCYGPTDGMANAFRRALASEDAIPEIGAEAQEILRVEAGIPKFGAELDASVIALEANLGPTHISLTKGCYVGQEIIARIASRGHTNRALTGFVVTEGRVPVPGDKLTPLPTEAAPNPREIGRLTSAVSASPAAGGRPIALGYARHEFRAPGTLLRVSAGDATLAVVPLPFLERAAVRASIARP